VELFFVLLVLLVVTRTFGEVAERLGQPGLVGELIAGIVLGTIAAQQTDLLPEIASLGDNTVFDAITDLGMFFIMLFAGVELQPGRLMQHSRGAFSVALGGMALPLALGVGLAWYYFPASESLFAQSVFLGTALAITAVPATVRILIDLGKLNSASGQIIVSAAVFDDILSLVLLAWLTALMESEPGVAFESGPILLKVIAFFAITTLIGVFIFPIGGRLLNRIRQKEFEFSALLVGALAFSVLAELLELHFIVGAFMAGLFFGRKTIGDHAYEDVRNKTSAMTFGFLAPIFFASVGLNLDFAALLQIPTFVILLLIAAFIGKFVGAGVAARLAGLSGRESAAVGVGMSARGAVELVIADIALEAGLFDSMGEPSPIIDNLFSAVVIMAVVTTLATPILLKRIYSS
jgi:Kef-type K+ transport system membrane component KefB